MAKTINESLNLLDHNFEIEREKLKLEQRINLLGNELLHNETSGNTELRNNIKKEIDNLKNFYCELIEKSGKYF